MNGVLGMLELLDRTALSAEQGRLSRSARQAADSLLTIINDILDFSKIEAGKLALSPSDFDLREVVEGSRDTVSPRALAKQLEIHCTLDPTIPQWVYGDSSRLRQILLNLMGNAVKFTEKGRVETRVLLEESRTEGILLRFEVRDTGVGISTADLARLFQAFSQADDSRTRSASGTGLGLAISKQLVELMGGEIGVESTVGVGSTFWFRLPFCLSRQPTRRLEPVGVTTPAGIANGLTVLLVEDNPVNREIAVAFLSQLGARVITASNGAEAIDAVERERFDMVFMDCMMPVVDGFEATATIRGREARDGGRLPIIALTASATVEERERCMASGMDDFVSKPMRPKDLAEAIRRWGGSGSNGKEASAVDRETESPVVEPGALDALRSMRVGDTTLLQRVLQSYLESAPAILGELMTRGEAGDVEGLRPVVHSLKSSSGMLGAIRLFELCRDLEGRMAGIGAEELRSAASDLVGELTRVMTRMRDLLQQETRAVPVLAAH